VPEPERHGIQPPQLKASAHYQQYCLARRIEYSDRQYRVADGPTQNCFFPRNSVIPEKFFADDQPEMKMKMDQLATAFIVPEIAQYRRMITVADGGKGLEIPIEQYRLRPMLVISCHQKVDITLASEYRIETPAAFPIAVRKPLPMKIVQNLQQRRWDRLFAG